MHIGKFLGRVRQTPRKFVKTCQRFVGEVAEKSLASQRQKWRSQGKFVCRHGVFFALPGPFVCPCLGEAPVDDGQWIDAIRMPALDGRLKCIVAVPFEASWYQRLGQLQAEMRRLGW